jgi:hypothetical protein
LPETPEPRIRRLRAAVLLQNAVPKRAKLPVDGGELRDRRGGHATPLGLQPVFAGRPRGGQPEALSTNPRFEGNYVIYLATGAAYGKPVAITEWNVPWPATDRFTAPLYVAGIKPTTEIDKDFIPAGRDFVRSDTGELTRDWATGCQAIDTDRTQAVHGWIGGETIHLKHVSFDIATPKAAVAVSSLDSKPIAESKRILITAIARVVASPGGTMPLLSEPVRGTLGIRAPEGLKLIPLAGDGTQLPPLPAHYADGRCTVKLPAERGTHWFLLTGEQ